VKLNCLKLRNQAKITSCHQSTTFKFGHKYVAMYQPLNGQSKRSQSLVKIFKTGQSNQLWTNFGQSWSNGQTTRA